MENKKTGTGLQQALTESIQNMANLSLGSLKPLMDGMMGNLASINKSVQEGGLPVMKIPQLKLQTDNCNCCPPENICPPHCIASINRCAMQGERIVVPFNIKNTCSHAKTWRIGVRELKDQDGQMAAAQPQLNKQTVTIEPGRSERVLMMLDLNNFTNGSVYSTEIVLREKDINQNICFTLTIDGDCNTVTAAPQDEQKYNLRWQGWQSHYYCEPPKNRLQPGPVIHQ
jgi:hypothetical protein